MIAVVENLIFRSRLPNGDEFVFAIVVDSNFLCKVEYARVCTLGNLVFECKLEVLEFVCKKKVAAINASAFAIAGTFEVDCAVFNVPVRTGLVFSVATPAVKGFAVEDGDVTVFVNRQLADVNLRLFNNFVVKGCAGSTVFLCSASAFRTAAFTITAAFLVAAGCKHQRASRHGQ